MNGHPQGARDTPLLHCRGFVVAVFDAADFGLRNTVPPKPLLKGFLSDALFGADDPEPVCCVLHDLESIPNWRASVKWNILISGNIANKGVMALDCGVATYGQRFLAVRLGPGWREGQKPRITQEKLAKDYFKRAAPVSKLENPKAKLPKASTIQEHATDLLQCEPWELLLGVPSEYDRLRWPDLNDAQLETLLAGLKVMPAHQLEAILRTCGKAVAALPDPLIQVVKRSSRKSKPGTEGKETQTHQRRKSA